MTEHISMLPFLNHAILILKNNKNVAKYLFLIQDFKRYSSSNNKQFDNIRQMEQKKGVLHLEK